MKPVVLAISGVKNSGKTTLIEKVIPFLKKRGLKVGVIKHDGHDFEPDVPGTDSYKHRKAGADGVLVFSKSKYMLIENSEINIEKALLSFQSYDLLLLEGFKFSEYPKLEIIRKENSKEPVSSAETVLAYISNLESINGKKPDFNLNEIESISNFIYSYYVESR